METLSDKSSDTVKPLTPFRDWASRDKKIMIASLTAIAMLLGFAALWICRQAEHGAAEGFGWMYVAIVAVLTLACSVPWVDPNKRLTMNEHYNATYDAHKLGWLVLIAGVAVFFGVGWLIEQLMPIFTAVASIHWVLGTPEFYIVLVPVLVAAWGMRHFSAATAPPAAPLVPLPVQSRPRPEPARDAASVHCG
jgi:hypothetical protein